MKLNTENAKSFNASLKQAFKEGGMNGVKVRIINSYKFPNCWVEVWFPDRTGEFSNDFRLRVFDASGFKRESLLNASDVSYGNIQKHSISAKVWEWEKVFNNEMAKGGGVKKRSLMSVANLVDWKGEGIKKWYMRSYPTDDLGEEINDEATFTDLWNGIHNKENVYNIMGVGDREEFYYEMQSKQEANDFKDFIKDLKRTHKVSPKTFDWLMENRGGYYHLEPNMLDFSTEDLTDELIKEGLVSEKMERGGNLNTWQYSIGGL